MEGLGVAPKENDIIRVQFAAYLKDGTLLSRYEVFVNICIRICIHIIYVTLFACNLLRIEVFVRQEFVLCVRLCVLSSVCVCVCMCV